MSDPILRRLREILAIPGNREGKARRIAAAIRETGGYPWVGIYDVSPDETGVIAWSGPSATPSTTRSKIVAPVLDATGRVAGLLGVESDFPDAFGDDDRRRLEECALALTPFWG